MSSRPRSRLLLIQAGSGASGRAAPGQPSRWRLLEDDEEIDVGASCRLAAGYGAVEGKGDEQGAEGFLGCGSITLCKTPFSSAWESGISHLLQQLGESFQFN